jgi:hypothetical protein
MSSVALSIPSLLSAPQKWAKCEKFREILNLLLAIELHYHILPLFLGTEISRLPNIGGADQQFRGQVWNLGPKTETEVFEAPFRVCPLCCSGMFRDYSDVVFVLLESPSWDRWTWRVG